MNSVMNTKPVILAVDDQVELLNLLDLMMSFQGYEVKTSQNAENLIDILHEVTPDIIFMDVNMRNINGAMLCTLLKANKTTVNIPIVLVSGVDNLEQLALEAGADAFIGKPFNTEEIEAVLNKYGAANWLMPAPVEEVATQEADDQ